MLTFRGGRTSSSKNFTGYAAGIGNVNGKEVEQRSFKLGEGGKVFAGHWVLSVAPKTLFGRATTICIDKRFNDTREIEDAEMYLLRLNRKEEPTRFQKLVANPFKLSIGNIQLTFGFLKTVTLKRAGPG